MRRIYYMMAILCVIVSAYFFKKYIYYDHCSKQLPKGYYVFRDSSFFGIDYRVRKVGYKDPMFFMVFYDSCRAKEYFFEFGIELGPQANNEWEVENYSPAIENWYFNLPESPGLMPDVNPDSHGNKHYENGFIDNNGKYYSYDSIRNIK